MGQTPTTTATVATYTRPPIAPGFPLLGNALDLLRRPHELFVTAYHRLGPIYRVAGGGREYVVLAGPEANAFLLHEGEKYLDNRPIYRHVAHELRSESYPIATAGERHAHLRHVLQPAFVHQAVAGYLPRMLEAADGVVRGWRQDTRLRVLDAMHRLVGEQLGHAMLGHPLGDDLRVAITFGRYSMGAGLGAYPTIWGRFPHYRAAKRRMFALMERIIAAHRDVSPGERRPADFVDLLLAARDAAGEPLSGADILANAQMAYSNALVYAAPACAFLLYALLTHPDALARVRAEVDAIFDDEPLDARALFHAHQLHGALLESMRLFPIALATPRAVVAPFQFAGYDVRPGDIVLTAVTVCHFLPEVFERPEAFDIDRYGEITYPGDDGQQHRAHPGAGMLVRYGLGPHACLASGLVDMLVMTTVATILRDVDLALDPPDYSLRRVVNPFPEPEARFAVRVVRQREASAGGKAAR